MKEIVLATRNRHKGSELAALLGDLGITIRTLEEFPHVPEVVEDGATCEANAIKKAQEVAAATGLPAVADDTGLEVDALNGRPGVYAARYAGEHATYDDNCRKLIQELRGVLPAQRTARFITVAALVPASGDGAKVTTGELRGTITETPVGSKGFGYDPVFFVPELGKTLAELTPDEKNRISHRAKAFLKLREIIQESGQRSLVNG